MSLFFCIGLGQSRVRLREEGIDLDCLPEQIDRLFVGVRLEDQIRLSAAQEEVVGLEVVRGTPRDASLLLGRKRRFERLGDPPGDLGLDREHVARRERAVEIVGPDVAVGTFILPPIPIPGR